MTVYKSVSRIPRSGNTVGRLLLTPAFLLMGTSAMAATIVDDSTLDIDSTTSPIDYLVRNNATLNMNGAATRSVTVLSGSALNIRGGTIVGNSGTTGITINESSANIDRATVTSETIGMEINRGIGSTTGSSVFAGNSTFQGAQMGAQITGLSTLDLVNSSVTGTGAGSIGMNILGGEVTATRSQISGDLAGVRMGSDPSNQGDGLLVLDNSHVEGRSGSAIVVEGAPGRVPVVDIYVNNGSTLTGGNGNLLEVNGGATANMNVDNSRLVGNVIVEAGSSAHLSLQNNAGIKGQMKNVTSLNVGDASYWEMTGNSQVEALTLAGGTVKFGDADQFYQLDLETLDGNGTFVMGTDFAQGKTDFLNINGDATGNHSLLLAASGAEPINPEEIRIVHTGGGDAEFSLVGDKVDVGAYSYGLKKDGTDWFLDPENRVISPGTRAVMALFNTAPTVWYGEATSLRSRMGELRFEPGQAGLWLRGYGSKYNVSEDTGVGYTQNQRGFSLGADMPVLDSQWMVGVMVGHSTSDLSLKGGTSGKVNSYYLGGYATWMDEESGLYFDAVAKLNRFHNEAKVGMSDRTTAKGQYNNTGAGLSAEVGRNIKLDDGFFVEPYAQLSTVAIGGSSYTMDNGLQAKGERTHSVMAKAGATIGRDFQLDDGSIVQPYLRAAMVHEFANNNKVSVNNNTFNNDLSGSRAEFGAGAAVKLSQNLQLHADFEHSSGKRVEQPWGANVGVRFAF